MAKVRRLRLLAYQGEALRKEFFGHVCRFHVTPFGAFGLELFNLRLDCIR